MLARKPTCGQGGIERKYSLTGDFVKESGSRFDFFEKNILRHSAARPKVSGKTALFPRNDRPYGLKCKAFQTENALMIDWHEFFQFTRIVRQEAGVCRVCGQGKSGYLFLRPGFIHRDAAHVTKEGRSPETSSLS
ncbi:hypothetical protein QUW15_05695 [Desulfovibrio piger]|nr:hypothetical protein [Desulfovibrio piger]